MHLTPAQADRAVGAVLGSATGDALGAPYEFGMAPLGPDGPAMIGGGLGDFAPGEWTDDTSMAWAVLDVAATGADLRTEEALSAIARNFRAWYDAGPADIGIQTRRVLAAAGPEPTGAAMTATARELHEATGRTAGNGSLMRTAAVALPHLDDPVAVAEAARAVSALTHYDPRAQEACALWSLAIRHAILTGELDLRAGLSHLDGEAVAYWNQRIDEAEQFEPARFAPNGWTVAALQAAWSAIVHTAVPAAGPECGHLPDALITTIGIGHDTDTIAAIAGALLGARYGASAIPARWRRILHGYPGLTGERLGELAQLAVNRGRTDAHGWPLAGRIDYFGGAGPRTLVPHPHDPGVWLADASVLDELPGRITAVVSLCRVGRDQPPAGIESVRYRLIDASDPAANPNLDFVLADAARTVAALRDEGHEVLLHCVAAQSRTPAVAAAYAMLRGVPHDRALADVVGALPAANPNPGFREALRRLEADSRAADRVSAQPAAAPTTGTSIRYSTDVEGPS